ncbi:MAG TPA: hypothetical protein VMV57_16440 [Terracidiphilus sp.]|nr:hypothetical protein [Terracidiphilus sp.]
MLGNCPKCDAHLEPAWSFCPACSTPIPHTPPAAPPAEPTPVRAAFSGLLIGFIVAPVLVIVGAMLCLTGLGALVGIPMIIGGILAPIVGPMIGFRSLRGNCPWCGVTVSSIQSDQSFACDACHHRIVIRDHKYVAVA